MFFLESAAVLFCGEGAPAPQNKRATLCVTRCLCRLARRSGGDGWTRTSDPLRVKQVLSQLSYASK